MPPSSHWPDRSVHRTLSGRIVNTAGAMCPRIGVRTGSRATRSCGVLQHYLQQLVVRHDCAPVGRPAPGPRRNQYRHDRGSADDRRRPGLGHRRDDQKYGVDRTTPRHDPDGNATVSKDLPRNFTRWSATPGRGDEPGSPAGAQWTLTGAADSRRAGVIWNRLTAHSSLQLAKFQLRRRSRGGSARGGELHAGEVDGQRLIAGGAARSWRRTIRT